MYPQRDAETAILTGWMIDGGPASTEALAQQRFISFSWELVSVKSEIVPLTNGSIWAGTIMSVVNCP